jgi:type VI secretion system protein ImpA
MGAEEDAAASTDVQSAGGAATIGQTTRPATREDMLRELERIADFFRKTEPHSPLAYTLEEAVRRGRLTWPELLAEVVPDDKVRSGMLVMLGIRPAPPG